MNTVKGTVGSDLNFSDVIDVIEHDPDYDLNSRQLLDPSAVHLQNSSVTKGNSKTDKTMLGSNASSSSLDVRQKAVVKILEQPASKALRFRYECEGRSAGSIPGANSTADNKTFPSIQVLGYRGKAVVVVSCVTKDSPYKPHPHSLVGKEGCKKGVCTLEINNDNMICTFSNLGIQCVKKKGIEEALKLREDIRVDPFHTGFAHRNQPQSIDLNAVRLCFQVFLESSQRGKFTHPLKPVVSEPIYDKKAMCDLTISKLSDFTCPASGGKELILLCDKVTKDDVQILFYQEEDGHVLWEGNGEFTAADVHKQVAISFRTPPYRALDIEEPVPVFVQLRRPSDGATSEPRPFQYLPMDSDADVLKRKRQRLFESNASRRNDFFRSNIFETNERVGQPMSSPSDVRKLDEPTGGAIPRPVKQGARHIKKEPVDVSNAESMNSPFYNYGQQMDQVPTGMPQYSLNVPMVGSYASPSVSPHSPYQNFAATHYNIPVHSPTTNVEIDMDHVRGIRDASIMDLDNLNIQHHPQFDSHDARAIQLPLSDCNISLLDSHLFSNLSIHDEDIPTPKENEIASAPTVSSTLQELPEFTISGMFSSTDLDGALDRITSLNKPS